MRRGGRMRGSTIVTIIVSAFLAFAAVLGVRSYLAEQRNLLAERAGVAEAAPKNTIIVAARPLRFGQPIRAEDISEIAWPSGNLPAGAFSTAAELVGKEGETRYVMSAMEKDEPVLASKITGPGQRATLSAALTEGMKAISIRVNDVLGVAGFVLPGDRVDILLTRVARSATNDGEQTFVDVLLQGVKVLAVDQKADDRADKPDVAKTITFEVTTEEAQVLTLASQVGTLSLALRNVASSDTEQTRPVTLSDLGGGPTAQALVNERAEADDSRLTDLEKLVGEMEDKLKKDPVVVEKEVFVEAPDPIIVAAPKPDFVVIGVSRDTKREEYRVQPLE